MATETVFNIILLASASVLCIALVIYLYKITQAVKGIESEIKDLSTQVKPLVSSIKNLSEKLISLSEDAKEPVDRVKEIVSDVKERVDTILEFEEKVRRGFEEPVNGLIKNFSAVVNGVNAFWNAYKKN